MKLIPEDPEILGATVKNSHHGDLSPGVWYAWLLHVFMCARARGSESVRMIHKGMKLMIKQPTHGSQKHYRHIFVPLPRMYAVLHCQFVTWTSKCAVCPETPQLQEGNYEEPVKKLR